MKDTKTVSDAKAEANRNNARKSTGPNTPRGKRHSRCNALKDGLYSKDLLISEKDRAEFEDLRQHLQHQIKPSTPMQWLAFDSIATCSWRCKLALRLESRQCKGQLQANDSSQPESADTFADPHLLRWYGSSTRDIRAGIKALDYASAEFANSGRLHDETKESLNRGFGPEFVDTLTHWIPMSRDAILLAEHLVRHKATFGELPRDPELNPVPPQLPEIVQDPKQSSQMVVKLLDERRHFLEEVLKIRHQRWSGVEEWEAGRRYDFNPGFVTAANRELRRAVAWYMELAEMGL